MRLLVCLVPLGLLASCATTRPEPSIPVLKPQPTCHGPEQKPQPKESLGSLTKEEIEGVIRASLKAIRKCYDTALNGSQGSGGRIKVQFSIGCNGSVFLSQIEESSFHDTGLEQCIVNEVATWQFPEPRNGGLVHVKYPFILRTK
jgi:hypothetical protein